MEVLAPLVGDFELTVAALGSGSAPKPLMQRLASGSVMLSIGLTSTLFGGFLELAQLL